VREVWNGNSEVIIARNTKARVIIETEETELLRAVAAVHHAVSEQAATEPTESSDLTMGSL